MKIENRGGKREGAGRKSKASEQKLIERLDRIIDEDEVLQVLKQLIKDGDLRAVQLYLSYRRGKPKDTMDLNTTGEGIGINFKDLITAIKKMINKKFLIWDEVDTRYFIFTGGRGSGKSFGVATSLLLLIMTESGHNVLFTRYTLRSANISIIPEFKEKIEMLGYENNFYTTKDEIINKATGSKILFRGIKTSSGDQTANLKSLQGITTWVMDEAEELVDEDIFDKIDLSVRQKGRDNRIILILNPTTKEHWIYERFFESKGVQAGINVKTKDVCYVHTTYKDNLKNLSQSYLNRIAEIKKHRPEKYKHQMLGGWLDKAEGVIFNNWKLGEFREVGTIVLGQDFGFSTDASTLLKN